MKLTESLLRELIKEEMENRTQVNEAMSDYNPLEILRTAGKYYIDLAKSPNPRKQFAKDMKDSGVNDVLKTASAIPFIGLPFGLTSIALSLGAGKTKEAAVQTVMTAAGLAGGAALGKGFTAAAANPRVAARAAQILASIATRVSSIPGGGRIAAAAQSLRSQLPKIIPEIGEKVTENELEAIEKERQVIAKSIAALSKNKLAKQLNKKGPSAEEVGPGEMYAGNRKDIRSSGGLFKESHTRGDSKVKLTMSQLRTMVQEQIDNLNEEDDSFSKAGEEIAKKGTEGVFTAKAKKRGMTAQEFARKVLANTDEYDTKTVRQASFAKGAKTVADKK
jgi:hypothetical protein